MGGPSDYSDCSGTIARCPPSTGGEGGGGEFYHTKTIVSDINMLEMRKHMQAKRTFGSKSCFALRAIMQVFIWSKSMSSCWERS